ncbi:DUF6090 family protein [Robiginitalea sp. SC105]|uniref:DUF6090 family protein n=1 Tax=Robiginitalea sp. SC105 TaxID=2762332 RepID=UPI00163A14E8|nr:DUF6090 family protein [Robiginitalea sp. SC105]MBC2839672.1 hypothetical protein [Robiginitalea sp. SC105]
MAKFLRPYRLKLITQIRSYISRRWYSYLFYALGEIVLVVIGILIAVQINGMNEARKQKEDEIESLSEILTGLQNTWEEVILALEQEKRWRACNYAILEHLDNQRPYDPELDQCFGCYYWSPTVQLSTSAYDQLKIRGLELISNTELRNAITHMFDSQFDVLKSEIETWDSQLLSSTIYPMHTRLFRKYYPEGWQVFEDEFAKPVDYEELLQNDTYKNILSEIISLRNYGITTNTALKADLEVLIAAIEEELETLRTG